MRSPPVGPHRPQGLAEGGVGPALIVPYAVFSFHVYHFLSLLFAALWRPLRAALGLCPYVWCSIVYHPPDAVLDGCGHWSAPKKAIVCRWADSQPAAQFRLGQAQALPCGLQVGHIRLTQSPGHNTRHLFTPLLRARQGPFSLSFWLELRPGALSAPGWPYSRPGHRPGALPGWSHGRPGNRWPASLRPCMVLPPLRLYGDRASGSALRAVARAASAHPRSRRGRSCGITPPGAREGGPPLL